MTLCRQSFFIAYRNHSLSSDSSKRSVELKGENISGGSSESSKKPYNPFEDESEEDDDEAVNENEITDDADFVMARSQCSEM